MTRQGSRNTDAGPFPLAAAMVVMFVGQLFFYSYVDSHRTSASPPFRVLAFWKMFFLWCLCRVLYGISTRARYDTPKIHPRIRGIVKGFPLRQYYFKFPNLKRWEGGIIARSGGGGHLIAWGGSIANLRWRRRGDTPAGGAQEGPKSTLLCSWSIWP